jgi:hypothetical protein
VVARSTGRPQVNDALFTVQSQKNGQNQLTGSEIDTEIFLKCDKAVNATIVK